MFDEHVENNIDSIFVVNENVYLFLLPTPDVILSITFPVQQSIPCIVRGTPSAGPNNLSLSIFAKETL